MAGISTSIAKGGHVHRTWKLRNRSRLIYLFIFLISLYVTLSGILATRSHDFQASSLPVWKLDEVNSPGHIIPAPIPQAGNGVRNLSTDTPAPPRPQFGFVMRDFARRVLSRHIASSNILSIAPDATRAAKDGMDTKANNVTSKNPYDDVDFQSPYSIGGTFLLHAALEGHDIHAIDFGLDQSGNFVEWGQTLDQWWGSFGHPSGTLVKNSRVWSSAMSSPKWILAAIVDLFHPTNLDLIDQVWDGADRFLSEVTMTYVVVAMHSRKVNGSYQYGGLAAAKALLDRRYKLQTLLASHYHTDLGKEGWTEQKYGPNALFKTVDNVRDLLRWGADTAEHFGGGADGQIFTAYIFATQGLDLAIPSNRVFIDDKSRVIGDESTMQINLYKPLDFKICPQALHEPKLEIAFSKILGDTAVSVTIPLDESNRQIRHYHPRASPSLGYTYQYTQPGKHFVGPGPHEVELWTSHQDFDQAEAACARVNNYSKCVTRVIESKERIHVDSADGRDEVPNIVLVLIDPISRPHFHRSMPKTSAALERLGFTHFGNYSSIGPNSGKNQAGLYSGMPLANRDGIKRDTEGQKWLWDELQGNGFVTLKAENGCIENSNMVKSLEPNTTHGSQLTKLFCFDFDRPNCLGPDLAARHLMSYGEEFLVKYEERRKRDHPLLRWAAFLHFIDTHEDTMVLSSMLDIEMASFLERLAGLGVLDGAFVVVTSDHGLHYGPYFQSRSGRREATEPLLYIRPPPNIMKDEDIAAFQANAAMWTTPFDLHETMVSLTLQGKGSNSNRKGTSFFTPLGAQRQSCDKTEDIPQSYCALKFETNADVMSDCTKMPKPPNVLSFYADFPRESRSHFPMDCKLMQNASASKASFDARCQCATSHREWHRCGEHPWGAAEAQSASTPEEYFALVKCRGQKMSVDTRVVPSQDFLARIQQRQLSSSIATPARQPNILFIEVDSVSIAYANRHLPRTRSFLKRYRLKRDSNGQVDCVDNLCAPDFNYFALSGPNSIANQVAALSGCVVARFHANCFDTERSQLDKCSSAGLFTNFNGDCVSCPKGSFLSDPLSSCWSEDGEGCCSSVFPRYNASFVCKDPTRYEFGMQLFRRGPRRHATYCPLGSKETKFWLSNPWIFEVAKTNGYVTFFGDEFCYEGSPFVAQDNVFPLKADFELQRLYCRLQESRQYNFSASGPRLCASQRTGSGTASINPGFDLINEIWHSPELLDSPKFAYLNAMAAHDYDANWIKMVAVAEEYDVQLEAFLRAMISHERFSNTIIVIRSDHGLQGGPTTMEYSMQVEHRDPWAQLILPRSLLGASLEPLYANQGRIVTGHDLYRTLRGLMALAGRADGALEATPAIPRWSYNILSDKVPKTRTCVDAKVPLEFCPCEEQVYNRPPSLGVCNPFDDYLDMFCIDRREVVLPSVLEL